MAEINMIPLKSKIQELIEDAIRADVDRISEEVIAKAHDAMVTKIRKLVAGIAVDVSGFMSYETVGQKLIISVEIPKKEGENGRSSKS